MDARSFIFHAAYGSGCPVPGWTESLHVIRTLTTHSHPMSIVTAFGTFLAGQIIWPFAAQSVFSSAHGDGEVGPSCA